MTKTLQAYLICALWSSVDDNGEPLDSNYSLDDISESFIESSKKDIEDFEKKAGDLLDALDTEQIGHDLWLTRNHHGAGFWDRGLGDIGEKLTKLAHEFGEIDLYVSDDKKIESM